MSENDSEPEMPQPCDEWHELITAAASAGRCAARELALRCSAWHLDRAGSVGIHVEPLDSPAAIWLQSTGQAVATGSCTGALVPVALTAADLHPAVDAPSKARSLRAAHAYAVAYGTMLADEAGVSTEIRLVPDGVPMPAQPSPAAQDRPSVQSPSSGSMSEISRH
ncbi:hypothetical protein [Parasphingorhabdus pacifica]